MSGRAAIVGVDTGRFRQAAPEVYFKDMMFESVKRLHAAAGVTEKDVQSIVTTGEDFAEGRAIADEFVPDQVGGILKPNIRLCADSIYGLFTAVMQIQAGLFDLVLVVGYDKPSEAVGHDYLDTRALDPLWQRPFDANPHALAGLEMRRYMESRGVTRRQVSRVVLKSRECGRANPRAVFTERLSLREVDGAPPVALPLRALDVAPWCDGAVSVLLGSAERAKRITPNPVWIKGIGWGSDASSLSWTDADLSRAGYLEVAAKAAYREAGITRPSREIRLAEVDDRYSFKELLHVEALGLSGEGGAAKDLERGRFDRGGALPVNPSGGSLAMGYPRSAAGLVRVIECYLQIRGEAGGAQVDGKVRVAVAAGWNGVPSRSGGVVVLGGDR
ncbi:MAG: hypothetical protein AB1742_06190 [bacterium]